MQVAATPPPAKRIGVLLSPKAESYKAAHASAPCEEMGAACAQVAAYGHMGRTPETVEKIFTSPYGTSVKKKVELFTWEKLDAVKEVKKVFGLK